MLVARFYKGATYLHEEQPEVVPLRD
jgi:hypothetical protein